MAALRDRLATARALTFALVLTLTVGCTAAAPSAPPHHLTARLEQARIDETRNVLSIAVTNPGPTTPHIHRLQLVAPPLETLAPTTVDTTIPLTPRIDLRVPYGPARCDGRTIPRARPAHAVAWIRHNGTTTPVRLPLPHPDPLLQRIVTGQCGQAIVSAAADVAFASRWTSTTRDGHPALHGHIRIRRKRPGPTVTLHDIRGSVILQLRPRVTGTPVATLRPQDDRLRIPVRIIATRCDAHALAESKKTFVLPYWVSIDGGRPHYLEFTVSPALRTRLQSLIARTCRPATPSG
ncbi:hypothetical protein [Thermostaphylospora chromogena]|uniref:Uncharacterized protein n=1 Tax=Thermostaphylospora chromogena TaxID=35622 RepID=A0A1H1GEU7_9ACTN|nr:hypothetical protein [Thermostaphylospora chromogena]SDR11720.1 hypothetical protein SAMN04489764_3548 [Thermostaphylospora chromogena]